MRARPLTDLQCFGLLMVVGALAIPVLPNTGVLCPLRRFTGIPCPMCGSTTAVLHLAHAEPLAALAANPMGVLIAVCCVAAFLPAPWRHRVTARLAGWRAQVEPRVQLTMTVVVFASLWIYQLHRFAII